jgi:hypothetical protein
MAATTQQRLAVLEAELADLRRAVVFTSELGDAIEARGYARGRESVLGGGPGQPARTPQAERWLHAVPEPEAQPELEAGA